MRNRNPAGQLTLDFHYYAYIPLNQERAENIAPKLHRPIFRSRLSPKFPTVRERVYKRKIINIQTLLAPLHLIRMISSSFQPFPLSGPRIRNNNILGYKNICDILCFGRSVGFFRSAQSPHLIAPSEAGWEARPVVFIASKRSRIPTSRARS